MRINPRSPRLLPPAAGRLLALVAALILGIFLGEAGLLDQVRTLWLDGAPAASREQNGLPVLTLDIPFENYSLLLDQRERALQAGAVFTTPVNYVNADVRLEGAEIPVRLRLPAGEVTGLAAEESWPFELQTRRERRLDSMAHFFLEPLEGGNGPAEWAFLHTLRQEGFLTPQYRFVRLRMNGRDWGTYALRQGPELSLLQDQQRPPGVIIGFAADRWWQAIAHYAGDPAQATADPLLNLDPYDPRLFETEALQGAIPLDNEMEDAQIVAATTLLRGLQRGELPANQVFDVARYGRFLALVDLWGAEEATQLSNFFYYYHPQQARLQPLVMRGNPSLDTARLAPAATYYDRDLQAAYVAALAEVSDPAYLAALQVSLEPELAELAATLPPVEQQRDLWEAMEARQVLLRRTLQPAQPVLAFLGSPALAMDAVIEIEVANLLNLPVEIVGFDIAGATFLDVRAEWVQDGAVTPQGDRLLLPALDPTAPGPQFVRFHLPLTEIVARDEELSFREDPLILIATRLAGAAEMQLTPARTTYREAQE
jgi:hypothetical protein